MDKIKSNTNFYIEINEYNIHVPYYQRDYAQGRTDGGRIDNIRRVFVEELFKATNGKEICHLGLVFGSYDEHNKVFIAVDGQQRLTTVFLLYWYVAWRENKLSDYKNLLEKFSWSTRNYSSQFTDLLFRIAPNDNVNVIDTIKSHCDYFPIWENDPTVKGMLTMLEEIETQYSNYESDLCENLFQNDCNIKYDILKLEKDSDGKTYLKMNSRGRSLTTFELFKSKFIDKYHPNFGSKFDNEWLNFMLERAKNEGQFGEPDFSFMNLINEYAYLQLRLNEDEKNDTADNYKEFINAKITENLIDTPFISFEKYQNAFENKLGSFEKFFDWIIANYDKIRSVDDNIRFKDSRFFIDAIIRDNNPNFSHRVKLFALFKFAELSEYNRLDEKLYKSWSRVFRNLVANTDIEASYFGKICKTINKINGCNIYLYLSKGGELSTFDGGQIKEEVAKAKQILNGEPRSDGKTWEEIIIEAENYAFFKGAIRFLFQDAEGNVTEDSWNNFDTKWENAQKYFDSNGVKDENNDNKQYKTKALLMKSLLANCNDFWGKIFWHFEFSNDTIRWKRILTSKNWINAVDAIMREEVTAETTEKNIESIKESLIKNIVDDALINHICSNMSGSWIRRTYHKYLAIWQSGYPSNQVVLNPILAELKYDNIIDYSNDNKITNCRYYKCVNKNVDFKYGNNYFQWWGNPNEKELDVYLMEDNWADYKKRPNPSADIKTDEDMYYCFRVYENTTTESFKQELEKLIAQA